VNEDLKGKLGLVLFTLLCIALAVGFMQVSNKDSKLKEELDKELKIAVEEKKKYPLEFNWNSELNEDLKLDEQMFKDIQIKTDEKTETVTELFKAYEETKRYAYIDDISKEQFMKFTEEDYINFILNKVKPLESLDYNWLEIRFEDGTNITYDTYMMYDGSNDTGTYNLESIRDEFKVIGKIRYEINDDKSLFNVRYEDIENVYE